MGQNLTLSELDQFFEPELDVFRRRFNNLLMFCADSAAEEVEENV